MSVDYDARKVRDDADESFEPVRRNARSGGEFEDADTDDVFELPDSDLSGEELTVRVVPRRHDEFVCASCHLVVHRRRRAPARDDLCLDCV
jgi:hypothetical protein